VRGATNKETPHRSDSSDENTNDMAGSNAKKRLEANRAKLRSIQLTAAATTAFYLAVRLLRGGFASPSSIPWLGLSLTVAAHAASYAPVASAGSPTYDSRGQLLDGGADLSRTPLPTKAATVGLDLVYLTCLVQIAAAFTPLGYWLWALAPAYGAYAALAPAIAYATGARRRLRPSDFVSAEDRAREGKREARRERKAGGMGRRM
jgi:hypothetical protein